MRIIVVLAVVLIGTVAIPVLVKSLSETRHRSLVGVSLADTRYTEVHFENHTADIRLAGMLFTPPGDGPFPAIVMIHGSGTSRRDNPWYLTFVRHLQQNGIVVLLPDKRGSGKSGGNWHAASFEELATDTLAAIRYLRESYPEKIGKIGLLGASQGGQVAPLAAKESADVAFVINVVGSAVPFHEALLYEEVHNLRDMGLLPGISDAIARVSSLYIRKVSQREFWDAVGNYDPLPHWNQLEIPALVLYGAEDRNTASHRSAERLRSLQKTNIRVVVFPGSGHALEDPPGTGNSLVRREALKLIVDFVRALNAKQFEWHRYS